MDPFLTPTSPLIPKPGIEKSPFQILAIQFEVDENVSTFYDTLAGCEVMQ